MGMITIGDRELEVKRGTLAGAHRSDGHEGMSTPTQGGPEMLDQTAAPSSPTAQTVRLAGVGEVEIRTSYLGTLPDGEWFPEHFRRCAAASHLRASVVLAKIADAWVAGARALLVTVECEGGDGEDGFRIYHALRDFSRDRGPVVAYVPGYAASSAPVIALAGDVVVIDTAGSFVIHSALGPGAAAANRRMLEVFESRTLTARPLIEEWLTLQENTSGLPCRAQMLPEAALSHGWADMIGGRDVAEDIAAQLAAGRSLSTVRQQVLRQRLSDALRTAAYTPQAGDGYKANEASTTSTIPTQVDGTKIGVKSGALVDSHTTRGGSVDNIWPNPGSETDPPAGADATRAEWVGRVNVGAPPASFAGTWVRQISTAIHSAIFLGDTQNAPTGGANQSQLGFAIPCSPGESFYIEAQAKMSTATAGETAGAFMWFLDATNTEIAGTTVSSIPITAPQTTYAKASASRTAPAGTVKVLFGLYANCSLGAVTAQYDAIYARRQIDQSVVVQPTPVVATMNSWTAARGLAYWKDVSGMVHVKGSAIAPNGGGTSIFTLPVGFRPAFDRGFEMASNTATTETRGVQVNAATGVVQAYTSVGVDTWDLSCIHFLAEQ